MVVALSLCQIRATSSAMTQTWGKSPRMTLMLKLLIRQMFPAPRGTRVRSRATAPPMLTARPAALLAVTIRIHARKIPAQLQGLVTTRRWTASAAMTATLALQMSPAWQASAQAESPNSAMTITRARPMPACRPRAVLTPMTTGPAAMTMTHVLKMTSVCREPVPASHWPAVPTTATQPSA